MLHNQKIGKTMQINDVFFIENAKSKAFDKYEKGDIPFVTNGDYDNSIKGYVKPFKGDKIFYHNSICVSSFCQAIIHSPPFIARGNGGSGLVVLIPKTEMSEEELYFYAAQINRYQWKFSYSRMVIEPRIKNLELVEYKNLPFKIQDKLNKIIPPKKIKKSIRENKNIKLMKIDELCNVSKKTAIAQTNLNLNGNIPYVTTTSTDNGVSNFVDEEPNFNKKCLTVALNGSVCEVFFQLDDFITSSDNAVLDLKSKYSDYGPHLLFYIGAMLKTHKWRYNYYRKLKKTELENLEIPIPYNDKVIDIEYIKSILKNAYCWDFIKPFVE